MFAIIVPSQFLLGLDKPLGAAGNHALAGRYATMLKSAPDFDYTFTKAIIFKCTPAFHVLRSRLRMILSANADQRVYCSYLGAAGCSNSRSRGSRQSFQKNYL